jgi:hypothetical protein
MFISRFQPRDGAQRAKSDHHDPRQQQPKIPRLMSQHQPNTEHGVCKTSGSGSVCKKTSCGNVACRCGPFLTYVIKVLEEEFHYKMGLAAFMPLFEFPAPPGHGGVWKFEFALQPPALEPDRNTRNPPRDRQRA